MKADAECACAIYTCCGKSWVHVSLLQSKKPPRGMKLIACMRFDLFIMMNRIYEIVMLAFLHAVPSTGKIVAVPPAAVPGLDFASTQPGSPSISSLGPDTIQSASLPYAFTLSSPSTPSTDTVWDLLESLDDTGSEDLAWTTDTSNDNSILTKNSSSLNPRDLVSAVDKVRAQRALNVIFNSTDHGGYNLTIPGCLSADAILGDAELPNGSFVTNATFATLINSMQLPEAALHNYTLTMATTIYDKINATLAEVLCEGAAGATRQLLMPDWARPAWREPGREGFWTACVIGLLGSTGIAWLGTRVAIAHHAPTQNITVDTEVAILAATTALEFIFVTMVWRLQTVPHRYVGRFEAMVLNAFIWLGGKILAGLEYINTHSCISTETEQEGLKGFIARMQSGVQAVRFGYARNANAMSSQNLVGSASLTNIGAEPVAQPMAAAAMEQVAQEIGGGTQPGATCGGIPPV